MKHKIIDEFTDLPVTKQRKHQLRNPDKLRVIQRRYEQTEKYKSHKNELMKQYYIKKLLDD